MNVLAQLDLFNGKNIEPLEQLATASDRSPATINHLCDGAALAEVRYQVGATWILKRFHDEGLSYSDLQARRLVALLLGVAAWEAKLHLLQVLPALAVAREQAADLQEALELNLDHDNKFVRAWSYNGLAVLANQHAEYRSEVNELLARAYQAEAASVKARIRNVLKTMKWTTTPR